MALMSQAKRDSAKPVPKGVPQRDAKGERRSSYSSRKKTVESGAAQKCFEKEELVTRFNVFLQVKQAGQPCPGQSPWNKKRRNQMDWAEE